MLNHPTIPQHVAIIMDGNGRWALHKGKPRTHGHIRGATRVRALVKHAHELGIPALTLFAFSTENWNRPTEEINILWKLLKKFVVRYEAEMDKYNIQLAVIGQLDQLSPDLQHILRATMERLKKNSGMRLTFALSYGSKAELVQAAQQFALDCVHEKCMPQQLDEVLFESYLEFKKPPRDVDLLIRTSGEQRLSNFLLWQSAYAELIFVKKHWPDFTVLDLDYALQEFAARQRRYGAIAFTQPPLFSIGSTYAYKS